MNTENRVSPQAPEIEEAIIGACLIEQRAIPLIADKLRPEMFYVLRHQLIYAAILAMYHAGMKIDILTVKEELSHRGKLEEAGGAFGITQLSSKVATSAHLEYHAQIVHEKYLRREMILGFNKLLACALDETMDIDDSLMDTHNLLDRLEGEFGHNNHMRDMDELMTATMTEAEGRIANNINGVTGIPTGLADLDRMTSGLQNGELVVIAARPGVGKTAFALHLARNAAMAGHAVAVYSLEMQGERLADRWLTAASEVSARHWRSGTVTILFQCFSQFFHFLLCWKLCRFTSLLYCVENRIQYEQTIFFAFVLCNLFGASAKHLNRVSDFFFLPLLEVLFLISDSLNVT